jgi:hypothetical protein
MRVISHRGNLDGPDPAIENRPDHISTVLYDVDCEVDVWYTDAWYLGHDEPLYKIDYAFLNLPGLWLHAKNIQALEILLKDDKINCFWHDKDKYTLTSHGYVWAYPNEKTVYGNRTVAVLPEWHNTDATKYFGVCTDYVKRYLK